MFALGPSEESGDLSVAQPGAERAARAAFAAMAYWYYRWDWGEAIAFDGLDVLSKVTDDDTFATFVTRMLDRWIRATDAGKPPSRFGPANCLLNRWPHDARVRDFATRIGDHFLTVPHGAGDALLLDAPRESIFVDSLYGDPLFLVRLGKLTADARYVEAACALVAGHLHHLQDRESRLFGHVASPGGEASPSIFWGRGNGWAALGLAEFLAACPADAPRREDIVKRFEDFCAALIGYRIPGGGWRNLIDVPESYPESSTTAMIVAALTTAIEAGILDDGFRGPAEEAWAAIEHRIDTSGHLVGVSYRPGVNGDPARYEHTPTTGAYPWGQGAYLKAIAPRLARGEAG